MRTPAFFRFILICTMLWIVTSGCEKTADNIKLPETKAKLVVGCFLSPQDDTLKLTLTRSNPIFGSDHRRSGSNDDVRDATVSISNGSQSVTLLYNASKFEYEIPASGFSIVPGESYSLNVSTPQGESVSAACTVPVDSIYPITLSFDTLGNEKSIFMKWDDIKGKVNYYRVFGQKIAVWTDSSISVVQNFYTYVSSDLVNDIDADGGSLKAKFIYNLWGGSASGYAYQAIDLYLLHLDADYYMYQNSLNTAEQSAYDPFSEPAPVYTNIKGGLGVFCSFQKTYLRKRL